MRAARRRGRSSTARFDFAGFGRQATAKDKKGEQFWRIVPQGMEAEGET